MATWLIGYLAEKQDGELINDNAFYKTYGCRLIRNRLEEFKSYIKKQYGYTKVSVNDVSRTE